MIEGRLIKIVQILKSKIFQRVFERF